MRHYVTLFALFLSPTLLISQFITHLEGTVLNRETLEPIPYVEVSIPEYQIGTYTNKDGFFIFAQIEPIGDGYPLTWELSLDVSHIGYEFVHEEVLIQSGTTNTIELKLKQEPIRLDEILVASDRPLTIRSQVYTQALSERAPRDVGDFFKTLPGASAVKKGGYAQDPSIRGFQRDQLNVQFDGGVKIWGGCPNRMDPPTSHIQADDLERIEVIKGPFSVRWGQTLGGIVNLVMQKPEYTQSFKVNGGLNLGYETNGENLRSRAHLRGGSQRWDFYVGAGMKSFHDYETGVDSIIVPSAFEIQDYSTKIGLNFSEDSRLQVNFRQARVGDVDFPGLPMDARKDASDIVSLGYTLRNINSWFNSFGAKVYSAQVSHIMDNRDRPNFMMVEAVTDADTRTQGGRIELGLSPISTQSMFVGVDYYDHGKTGFRERFVKTNPCNTSMHPNKVFIDSVWQGAQIQDLGLFMELTQLLSAKTSFSLGVRGDQVQAQLNEPSSNFIQRYGSDDSWEEMNFSGMAVLKYSPRWNMNLTLGAGRGTRSPDLTERFINHLPVGASPHEHVGNPVLKSEINHQLELGFDLRSVTTTMTSSLFYSQVNNYIFASVDSTVSRLFLPCNDPNVAKVFQNIDQAWMTGYEVSLTGLIGNELLYEAAVAYTLGENADTGEPLPEIAPLETSASLRYSPLFLPAYVQLEGRWVQKQNKISESYGENTTPAFNIYNLKAGVTLLQRLNVTLAVNNITDEAYYEHLSRNFAMNTAAKGLPLYEPGRNVILGVNYLF